MALNTATSPKRGTKKKGAEPQEALARIQKDKGPREAQSLAASIASLKLQKGYSRESGIFKTILAAARGQKRRRIPAIDYAEKELSKKRRPGEKRRFRSSKNKRKKRASLRGELKSGLQTRRAEGSSSSIEESFRASCSSRTAKTASS